MKATVSGCRLSGWGLVVKVPVDGIFLFRAEFQCLFHIFQRTVFIPFFQLQPSPELIQIGRRIDVDGFIQHFNGFFPLAFVCEKRSQLFVGFFMERIQLDDFPVERDGLRCIIQPLLDFSSQQQCFFEIRIFLEKDFYISLRLADLLHVEQQPATHQVGFREIFFFANGLCQCGDGMDGVA